MNSIGNAIAFMRQMQPDKIVPQREQRKGGLFNNLDTDSSGGISQSEFEVLAQGISKFTGKEINAAEVLSTYDVDKNNELSGEELFKAMSAIGVMPPHPHSSHEVKSGMAADEMNLKDRKYHKIARYIDPESHNLHTGSVKVSA